MVGSIAFDSVQTPFGTRERALGGAANFFSVTASLFSKIQLVGVIGADFPTEHLNFLKSKGVDLEGVQKSVGKTFHWQGFYGYDLNEAQTLKTELNVFGDFDPVIPESYRESRTVFLANIDPVLQLKVLEQVQEPKLVAMDTMNFWIESKKPDLERVISRVDILFINEAEIRQLAENRNTLKAVRAIQALGPKTIIVKRGEYGAMLFHGDTCFFVPAFPVEDLFDPTGAGDTFAAGFMGYLERLGRFDFAALKEAMVMGSVMASFVIEDFSFDRIKRLSEDEIAIRREDFQKLTH